MKNKGHGILEMFVDYSLVLKGKAKENQDTDSERTLTSKWLSSTESLSLLGQLASI